MTTGIIWEAPKPHKCVNILPDGGFTPGTLARCECGTIWRYERESYGTHYWRRMSWWVRLKFSFRKVVEA